MQRRHFFQSAGVLAAGSVLTPVIAEAVPVDPPSASGSLLAQINKKRLLHDIRLKYKFSPELALVDVEERAGQLFLSIQNQEFSFELCSSDRGLNWRTV